MMDEEIFDLTKKKKKEKKPPFSYFVSCNNAELRGNSWGRRMREEVKGHGRGGKRRLTREEEKEGLSRIGGRVNV